MKPKKIVKRLAKLKCDHIFYDERSNAGERQSDELAFIIKESRKLIGGTKRAKGVQFYPPDNVKHYKEITYSEYKEHKGNKMSL